MDRHLHELPIMSRPRRIAGFHYRGFVQAFITATTPQRARYLAEPAIADRISYELLKAGRAMDVEVTVYCVMPDHVHALLTGVAESADVAKMVRHWKQSTGFWFRQHTGLFLWQRNYWDVVLRSTEEQLGVVRYILRNPLEEKLAPTIAEYSWIGSDLWNRDDLIELASVPEAPYWWQQ